MLRLIVASLLFAISSLVFAADEEDFFALPLEELFDIEVISAGKKAENIFEVSAAIHVITNDEIRRSGATSIPEVLRMVPGLNVSRLDAHKWSISARGFNFRFGNKLLVLIDGRSIYTPSFSGVYWEQHQFIMDDIERIEIIRGPGATLWGSNAVNGVINIITRSSKDTVGSYAKLNVGSDGEKVELRRGVELKPKTFAKAYLLGDQHNDYITESGDPANDDWERYEGGFRVDSSWEEGRGLTVIGNLYRARYSQFIGIPVIAPPILSVDVLQDRVSISGSNLLGRYEMRAGEKVTTSLQLYYDQWQREEGYFDQESETYDLELFQKNKLSNRHEIIWGVGYRTIHGEFSEDTAVSLVSDRSHWSTWNGFIQDEVSLHNGQGKLVLGSKFEKGDFSDFEIQPNIRMLWKFSDTRSAWWAVSKAVRTPSISNLSADIEFFPTSLSSLPLPVVSKLLGSAELDSETLMAYEVGYRSLWGDKVKTDLSLFYHEYDDMILEIQKNSEIESNGAYFEMPVRYKNAGTGRAHGAELSVEWSVRKDWRLNVAYSHLTVDVNPTEPLFSYYAMGLGRTSPKHQLSIQSHYNFNSDIQFDAWIRYYDEVWSYLASVDDKTEPYWDLDLRVSWRLSEALELQLVGQDLLESERVEGYSEAYDLNTIQIQRAVYGALEYRFD